MATCVLDDLVPSVRCNKITLEPIRNVSSGVSGTNYAEYDVFMDVSVIDTIDQHDNGGLANYMLTDTFRKNVSFSGVFSRDLAVKNFVDFLRSNQIDFYTAQGAPSASGLIPAQSAYLFRKICSYINTIHNNSMFFNFMVDNKVLILDTLAGISNGQLGDISTNNAIQALGTNYNAYYMLIRDELYMCLQAMPKDSTVWNPPQSFLGKLIRHAIYMVYSKMTYVEYSFESILPVPNFLNQTDTSIVSMMSGWKWAVRTLDEDGNIYYDIKLQALMQNAFTNENNVSNCYFHMVSYLDMTQTLLDKGVDLSSGTINPWTYETMKFYYNDIDECAILKDKLPASPMVQDFRISERVQEIIRSDRISLYDKAIDDISLISSELDINNHNLTSQLFSSYINPGAGYRPHTKNYFYFDMLKFLKRKSHLSFLYNNICSTYGSSSQYVEIMSGNPTTIDAYNHIIRYFGEIYSMDIYRVRIDEPANRVLVSSMNGINPPSIGGNTIPTSVYSPAGATWINSGTRSELWEFEDAEFQKLTDGVYTYEIEMSLNDPIINSIKFYAGQFQQVISILRTCVDYIHNNAGEYNELRDEISATGRSWIWSQLTSVEFVKGHMCFELLHYMFTGSSLAQIQGTDLNNQITNNPDLFQPFLDFYAANGYYDYSLFPLDSEQYTISAFFGDSSKITRRVLENYLRITQDLQFAINKFVNITNIENINTTSALTPYGGSAAHGRTSSIKETLHYKRRWSQTPIKAGLDHRMILNMFRHIPTTKQMMRINYTFETQKHTADGTALPQGMLKKLNFLTPLRCGNQIMRFNQFSTLYGDSTSTFVKVIDAALKKPDVMEREINAGLYSLSEGGYTGGVEHLKNDSGVFETTLHEYGVTVNNLTATNLDTTIELEKTGKRPTFGIDFGRNDATDKSETVEANQQQLERLQEALLEAQGEVIGNLLSEKVKKEDLVMNILVEKTAHHILDRTDLVIQSGDNESRFRGFGAGAFQALKNSGKPYPKLLPFTLIPYYRLANESTHTTHTLRIMASRFVVDNTFLVFYLKYIDEDLNPVWAELTGELLEPGNSTLLNTVHTSYSTGWNKILCKLKRFRHRAANGKMSAGQGSTSELEIEKRYFTMRVG